MKVCHAFGWLSAILVAVFLFAFPAPASATPTRSAASGLVFWNKLGSEQDIQNSMVGPGGVWQTGSFVPGPFGNALEISVQNLSGAFFPTEIIQGAEGCVEFWAKAEVNALTLPPDACIQLVKFETAAGEHGYPLIHFDPNDGAGNGGLCVRLAGFGSAGTGQWGFWTYTNALRNKAVAEWHHYALVWTTDQIPSLGSPVRHMAVYVDGELNTGYWISASSVPSPVTHPAGRIAFPYMMNNAASTLAIDNIKIWNYAKADFSDRFDEDAGYPEDPPPASGLVFWNKLGSEQEITGSMVGPGGVRQTGSFVPGPFGNALEISAQNLSGAFFPAGIIQGAEGCVEFWARAEVNSQTMPANGIQLLRQETAAGEGVSSLIHFVQNDGRGSGGLGARLSGIGSAGTGPWGFFWTYTNALRGKAITEWHHYALVWSTNRIVSLGSPARYMAIYVDGELNTGCWDPVNNGTPYPVACPEDGRIAFPYMMNNAASSLAVDNVKVWNFAKTEFSDRFDENAGAPGTCTVTFDAGGGTVEPPSKTVTFGSPYGGLPVPTPPAASPAVSPASLFGGWFTEAGGAVTATSLVAIASNHTLRAEWLDPAPPPPASGLVFWNKLGSEQDIQNSMVGPGGVWQTGSFVPGPFGNALEINVQNLSGAFFPTEIIQGAEGCVEFWAKAEVNALTLPPDACIQLVKFETAAGEHGYPLIHFDPNDGAGNGGLCSRLVGFGSAGTGQWGAWTYTNALKGKAIAEWHHYALAWSTNQLSSLGSPARHMAVYVDGELNTGYWISASGVPSPVTHPAGRIAFPYMMNNAASVLAIDNIKIWNYAKADFSDRFNEDAGFPEEPPPASGLVLWNKLGSTNQVAHSEAGPGGAFSAGTFVPGPFGNALELDAGQRFGCTFPVAPLKTPRGSLEFWARLSGFPAQMPWSGGNPVLVGCPTPEGSPDCIIFYFNANNGGGDGGLCASSSLGHTGTGAFGSWTYSAAIGGGDVAEWHHYAVSWDADGIPGVGGGRRIAVFVDGSLNSVPGTLRDAEIFLDVPDDHVFGLMSHQGLTVGSVAFDNLKVWGHAKTDFSDRFTEDAGWAPDTCTVTFDANGGEANPSNKTVTFGSAYGELPIPAPPFASRVESLFGGWLTEAGEAVTATSLVAVASNHTLRAEWIAPTLLSDPSEDDGFATTGLYNGYFHQDNAVEGLLTVNATLPRGKLTAKAVTRKGTLNFRSPARQEPNDSNGTCRVTLTAQGGETIVLSVRENRVWGTLSGGSIEGELSAEGARNRFVDRADAEARTVLASVQGYYTAALPPQETLSTGGADAAPEGTGYLTLTISNNGTAKFAGILADGTRISLSSRAILYDGCKGWVCVPFFTPLYARAGWSGGLLWLDPERGAVVTDRELGWFVRWERARGTPADFAVLLDVCGGRYEKSPTLATNYWFSAPLPARQVPYHFAGGSTGFVEEALPLNIGVTTSDTRMTMTRGSRPTMRDGVYDYGWENCAQATFSFSASTGVFKGKFNLYYDYLFNGHQRHKKVSVPYAGVLVPVRGAAFADAPAGTGHCLVPDNDPAYKLPRSFLLILHTAPQALP